MHEDVWRIGIARDEAVALAAVEPLHRRFKGGALGLRDVAFAIHLRCRGRGAVVEFKDTQRLKTLGPLHSLAHDPCPLLRELEARLANAGLVQKDVALDAIRRFDKSVAL